MTRAMDADDEDKRAIADALCHHDGPEHRKAIAGALGVTVSQVSRWYRGLDRMTPRQVFATESALGLDPGELSAVAGFAPLAPAPSVASRSALTAGSTSATGGSCGCSTERWCGPSRPREVPARCGG